MENCETFVSSVLSGKKKQFEEKKSDWKQNIGVNTDPLGALNMPTCHGRSKSFEQITPSKWSDR